MKWHTLYRSLLCLLLPFLLRGELIGKINPSDSLLEVIQATPDGTVKVDLLNQLASLTVYARPDLTLEYASQADSLAREINYMRGVAQSLNRIGLAHWSSGELLEGLRYLEASLDTAQKIGDRQMMARNIGNIGLIYSGAGNSSLALSYYRRSLALFLELENQERIAITYNNIGKSFLKAEQYDSAIYYLRKAEALGPIYKPSMMPITTFNIADAYFKQKDYDRALPLVLKVNKMAQQENDRRGLIRAEQTTAEIYLVQGRVNEAEPLARSAQSLAELTGSKELIYITSETLAKVLAKLGKYEEAYFYESRHAQVKDSVQNQALQQRLDFLEAEKKQQEIKLLRQEQIFTQNQAKSQRLINYGLIAALALAVLWGFTFYQKQRVQNQANRLLQEKNFEISSQKEEISEQAEELQELNFVKDRLFSIISHDLRSPLRNLTELLRMADESSITPKQFFSFLPQLTNHVDQTTDMLDGLLVWAENQLDGEKLEPSHIPLNALVNRKITLLAPQSSLKDIVISNGIPAEVGAYADLRMTEIVIHNLIGNAIKFCQAGDRVHVDAKFDHFGMVEVTVSDTGIGIAPENISKLFGPELFTTRGTKDERGSGLGLMLCREFVERNGGQITVKSSLHKGSVFTFTLPAHEMELVS